MKQFQKGTAINNYITSLRNSGKTIGYVPTMGALHNGHMSLLQLSSQKNDVTVCSIFVNPTQFNDPNDLLKYPRAIEKDMSLLLEHGVDILFYPDANEIYPNGTDHLHQYELGTLEHTLEGQFRPGHFQGVANVLDRLFHIIQPDDVYFGQKDLQQCLIVKKLLSIIPEFNSINMTIAPIIREKSMLAMSSRNTRLTEDELNIAPAIYQSLLYIKEHIQPGDLSTLKNNALAFLIKAGMKPEYVSVRNVSTFEDVTNWDGQTPLAALVAAFLGKVRLIDNLLIP